MLDKSIKLLVGVAVAKFGGLRF